MPNLAYRVWTDELGQKRKSRGRPSQEEMAARNGEEPVYENDVNVKEKVTKVAVVVEMDVDKFLEHTKAAVEHMNAAANLSNNSEVIKKLRGFSNIVKVQIHDEHLRRQRRGHNPNQNEE